jgi:hypothetical protein
LGFSFIAEGWRRFGPLVDPATATAHRKSRRADPAASKHQEEWRAAMEALILVAASGGPTMFARIGVMQALEA